MRLWNNEDHNRARVSGRQPGELQALTGVVGPVVGGDVEHRREAQANAGFLLGGQAVTERVIGELPCFLAATSSEKGHGPAGHQRPAERGDVTAPATGLRLRNVC